MKLLHTGDIHLDSAFCGSDVLSADQRREGQRALLRRIFMCAREEDCDLILFSGDVFDGKYVSPETAELFVRLVRDAHIPVVVSPGNHDPYTEGSFYRRAGLPENLKIFSTSELSCFVLEELKTKVYGYAFLGNTLHKSPLAGFEMAPKDGYFHLLCAHGDMASPVSRYAPLTRGDLARLSLDYAALGHIHRTEEEYSFEGTMVKYCGFPEGRSFDETGDGGVWIVTLREGEEPRAERRILSENRYEIETVALDEIGDHAQWMRELNGICARCTPTEQTHLRLILTGTMEREHLDEWIMEIGRLEESFASLELRDLSLPACDVSVLEKDVSLRGAFYRELYPKLIDEDPKVRRAAARALQIGLAAIDGRRIPYEEGEV